MLVSEVISAAFREGNLTAPGEVIETSELAEALALLNAQVQGLLDPGSGPILLDWAVPGMGVEALTPPEGARLVVGITSAATVLFPEEPHDGARMGVVSTPAQTAILTLSGNGRAIGTASTESFAAGAATKEWLYRADKAAWVPYLGLLVTDTQPLPPAFDNLLVCGLSIALSARFGQTPRGSTVEQYTALCSALAQRYTPARRVAASELLILQRASASGASFEGRTIGGLVSDALQASGRVKAGDQPLASEVVDALAKLNSFVQSIFGMGVGAPLRDWEVPDRQRSAPNETAFPLHEAPLFGRNTEPAVGTVSSPRWQYPPANSRLVLGAATSPIYFPDAPTDGMRMGVITTPAQTGVVVLNGNGRLIESASTYSVVAGSGAVEWLYRADKAAWVRLSNLELSGYSPFPAEFDDLLSCRLTIRLAAPGMALPPALEATYTALLSGLRARYNQASIALGGADDVPRSDQSYRGGTGRGNCSTW